MFTAAQSQIGSITVIAAREHRPEQPFSDDDIGRLRLEIFAATEQGEPTQALPLQLKDSTDDPPGTSGVLIHPRNHLDAVFSLTPVRVTIGHRYAFRVSNDTPGAILAVSVRPTPDPDNPTFIKAPNQPARRYAYAVAGSVCDRSENC